MQKKVTQPNPCRSKRPLPEAERYTDDVISSLLSCRQLSFSSLVYIYIYGTKVVALFVFKKLQPHSLTRLMRSLESKVKEVTAVIQFVFLYCYIYIALIKVVTLFLFFLILQADIMTRLLNSLESKLEDDEADGILKQLSEVWDEALQLMMKISHLLPV